ncbi:unnamed protein product [Cyclocybe aegerita]|uniref:DNA 3'-5' helicase n=1 Tax=Cyclocybe aegerita TaxID=1973307 RepID=A0A8S0VUU5_CYCAE|nr:unnamed protein product [Cyclocybe aegerita]
MVEWTSPHSGRLLGTHSAGTPTILIASTGWGKTSAFFGPILVLRHLIKNPRPNLNIPRLPRKPVALVVTLLIELGYAHSLEIKEYGLKAICLTAESLHAASKEGRNLLQEIRRCEWSIVLLSAERLVSREVDTILRDSNFQANLIVFGINKTHLLVPWGKDFRKVYRQIALLRFRLPDHTALVAASATLSEEDDYVALLAALKLDANEVHCIRLSCKRPNVRAVFRYLSHTLGSYQFPDTKY